MYRSLENAAPSLWLARRRIEREVPFAVVGGGLVGLSTAYWLSRMGKRGVVLEAENLAGRASGRNAGFLLTGSAEPFVQLRKQVGMSRALAFWRRSEENRRLLRSELLDTGRVECEFLQEGSWIAAIDESLKVSELRESAEALASNGFDLRWVEGRELLQASGSSGLGGAIFQPEDGGLDPVQLARGLAAQGQFSIHQGTRVRGLEPFGDRLRLICETGDTVAERVVLALNAYTPFLLPQLAAEIRPVRGQMLATEPGERPLSGVWYIDEGFQYLRQLRDGTAVLGGCRGVAIEEEVGYVESPTPRVQQALDAFLLDYFPDLASRSVARRWAGTMAFTPNGLPSLGEIPHLPGAFYAAGLGGHGLSLGFTLGRHLAQGLLGEDTGPFIG